VAFRLSIITHRVSEMLPRCVAVLPFLQPPLMTTWPCFVEGMYLLGRDVGWLGQKALWSYLENQDLSL
jgi:hypothetical protein